MDARLMLYATTALLVGAVLGGLVALNADEAGPPRVSAQEVPGLREYTLTIRATDLPVGPGTVWHAWTYDGQVPGPLLTVTAGEELRVTVKNEHDLVHSFHTHLAPYSLATDGSQLNTITGLGHEGMIHPGESYTFVFHPTIPGVYYYHCHSADGGHSISEHMAQGLYGAIVVRAPDEPAVRDESLFMAEIGFDVEGDDAPYFIMNGQGIPGGERALEELYAKEGIDGVAAEFGKTVPVIRAAPGETVRLSVVNIGNQIHSFHVHGMNLWSVDTFPGRIWPANVVSLVPGAADRVLITPTEPGLWLFHCHVVAHADAGMIGVLVVE